MAKNGLSLVVHSGFHFVLYNISIRVYGFIHLGSCGIFRLKSHLWGNYSTTKGKNHALDSNNIGH